MDFCILSDSNIITNVIICDDDATAAYFNAVPSYDGARIGDPYNPPSEPDPEPTEVEQLRAQVADLQNQILTMRLGG